MMDRYKTNIDNTLYELDVRIVAVDQRQDDLQNKLEELEVFIKNKTEEESLDMITELKGIKVVLKHYMKSITSIRGEIADIYVNNENRADGDFISELIDKIYNTTLQLTEIQAFLDNYISNKEYDKCKK